MGFKNGGKQLSHKEKRKLKKQQEYKKNFEMLIEVGGQLLEHAVYIKVENFSIAAKGKQFLTDVILIKKN